jgi:hypothetical protein
VRPEEGSGELLGMPILPNGISSDDAFGSGKADLVDIQVGVLWADMMKDADDGAANVRNHGQDDQHCSGLLDSCQRCCVENVGLGRNSVLINPSQDLSASQQLVRRVIDGRSIKVPG